MWPPLPRLRGVLYWSIHYTDCMRDEANLMHTCLTAVAG